jgi:hypothetical protein
MPSNRNRTDDWRRQEVRGRGVKIYQPVLRRKKKPKVRSDWKGIAAARLTQADDWKRQWESQRDELEKYRQSDYTIARADQARMEAERKFVDLGLRFQKQQEGIDKLLEGIRVSLKCFDDLREGGPIGLAAAIEDYFFIHPDRRPATGYLIEEPIRSTLDGLSR